MKLHFHCKIRYSSLSDELMRDCVSLCILQRKDHILPCDSRLYKNSQFWFGVFFPFSFNIPLCVSGSLSHKVPMSLNFKLPKFASEYEPTKWLMFL